MARPDKIEVALSREDRQLLRDIRDALRAMGVEPDDEDAAADSVRQLVEDARGTVAGSNLEEDKFTTTLDHKLLDDHIVADTKGYRWTGSGWAYRA